MMSRRFSLRRSLAPLAGAWPGWAGRAIRGHAFRGEFPDAASKECFWRTVVDEGHESRFTIHDSRNHGGVPMGRGAQAQTREMIDQQLAQQNAMNQRMYSSNEALGSSAASGYQNLLANPGYTDAQKSAITNLSQAALSSAFNALAQNASNRAARTRNSAGYGELIDSLARTQGQQSANLSQQDQIAFAHASRSDTLSALSGLTGLYGTDSSLLGRALGIPAQLLDARARNSQGSGFRLGFGPSGLSFGLNG